MEKVPDINSDGTLILQKPFVSVGPSISNSILDDVCLKIRFDNVELLQVEIT